MIEAGIESQIEWNSGSWVFLDVGFSEKNKTCGLAFGDGDAAVVQFGEAGEKILKII